MTNAEKSQLVKNLSIDLGFDACGIAQAKELSDDAIFLRKWLDSGCQADMHWMEDHFEKRTDPTKLVDNAKSVIVLLQNYYPKEYPENTFKIAKFALGEDYHVVLKKKLKALLKKMNDLAGPVNGRFFVDSAPVLERAWAAKAGLGWIGKNNLLINQKLGSFCFIAELIVDVELAYDKPTTGNCCACTRCIDSCPTGAIASPHTVDFSKCIAYHTIENKGEMPEAIRNKLEGQIFGCDICQQVCPWNEKATPTAEPAFVPHEKIKHLSKNDWQHLTEDEFDSLFNKTALKRAGYKKLMRNIGNASG